jgi:hypothetical protein
MKIKNLILDILVEGMIKTGEIKPEDPKTFVKASKKLVKNLRPLSEAELVAFIQRKCGASSPTATTRPKGTIPWRPKL